MSDLIPLPSGHLVSHVKNRTDRDSLRIDSSFHPHRDLAIGATVTLTAGETPLLSFHFGLNSEQARAMALELMRHADFADALTAEFEASQVPA